MPELVSAVVFQGLAEQVEVIRNLGFLGLFIAAIVGRYWGFWYDGPTVKRREEEWEKRLAEKEAECKAYAEENKQLW